MNIVIRAYLDGVIICLIACGVLAGIAFRRRIDTRGADEIYKEVTLFALGWPAFFAGALAYYLVGVWRTRDDSFTSPAPRSSS